MTSSSTSRKLGTLCADSGGKYVPPKTGSSCEREEDAHRPAAVPVGCDHVGHVDLVDVGAALAIDLDGDEAAR